MLQQNPEPVDVAIIGFGPVGATLAALLGQRGLRVAVFDKSQQIYPLPRAFALDHEALRVFQEIGIAGTLAPHMTSYRPTIYQGSDGEPIQHFDMGPSPYPLAWAPSYTFNQPALEASLRQAVGKLPGVSIHLGHEVLQLSQSQAHAQLDVRRPDGTQVQLRARYVVGCDGGTSPTRKQMGLTLKSLDFDEPWIVVDMHVDEDKLDRLPATNVQYCHPSRPCTYVVGPGTHRRWEFLLLADEAEQREMPHEAIWQLLAPGSRPRTHASGARRPTASMRWCSSNGAKAACCWRATARTRCRPSWPRACARACAMPSTSPGSSNGCSRGAPPKACWTAMATSVDPR